MCDGEIELSDRAKSLWGKTNRVDDTEWLPLYVHMADSAAMAVRIWDTWVPYGTKSIISRDLGNDDDLARKLMIFLAGVHDIGKATPVFQAKPISFGPDAESLAWKPEQAGLPMIAGLRDTSHPTHPIAGQVILERYFSLVHKWGERESRQYACVVGGHHGTPPDKSKLESARLGKTESGLDSEVWTTTQNELIEFIAGTVGIGDEEWKLLSKKRFSAQSAVLATGLVIIADWIASNSDADMFPLVRVHPLWDDDEPFGMTERKYDDIAGAAMIDTIGFNSSTLYRYATVNVDALKDQLQDANAAVEGVAAFVDAFIKSMPSGKQNTFANHTLPEDIVIVLRDSQPISAADAFEDPIKRKDGISVSRQGIERLGDRLNEIRINYGEEPVKAWHVVSGGSVHSLDEWSEQVTLPELEQGLRETLSAAYSA